MPRFTIPRRTVIRVGGATLALPALDIMTDVKPASAADGIKRLRFVTSYNCTSVSSAADANQYKDKKIDFVTPEKTGRDWEITEGLRLVEKYGVKGEMGMLSGLTVPIGSTSESEGVKHNALAGIPRGAFHMSTFPPQAAGKAYFGAEPENPRATTCDQFMAPILSAPDQYMNSLALQLSPNFQQSSQPAISWKAGGPDGKKDEYGGTFAIPVSALIEPDKVYRKLFGDVPSMAPAAGPAAPTADAGLQLGRRRSVVDVVYNRLQFILKRCSADDRRVLTRYADHIRVLEKQIDQLKSSVITVNGGKILAPPAPIPTRQALYPKDDIGQELYDKNAGWGDEKLRGPIQAELIHAAFLTDRTRVVSWKLLDGLVNYFPLIGVEEGVHQATHDPAQPHAIAAGHNWAIGQLAYVVALLGAPEARDPDGSRILDNTALHMYFEGGWGRGTEGGAEVDRRYQEGYRNPHSVDNMLLITAGGRNLGLHSYQHLRTAGRHPAEAILTQMRALGHDGPLNEVSGTIPEMMKAPA